MTNLEPTDMEQIIDELNSDLLVSQKFTRKFELIDNILSLSIRNNRSNECIARYSFVKCTIHNLPNYYFILPEKFNKYSKDKKSNIGTNHIVDFKLLMELVTSVAWHIQENYKCYDEARLSAMLEAFEIRKNMESTPVKAESGKTRTTKI